MNNKITLTLFFVFILSLTFVMAFGPGVPHQFYGDVSYNGAPAPNGVSVVAKIDGVVIVATTTSLEGKYGYNPLFLITDPEGTYEGKTIEFYVKDINTGSTAIFENGGSTQLNLAVTVTSPTTPPSSGGDSSGGGGGGGGSSGGSSGGSALNTNTDTNNNLVNLNVEEEEETNQNKESTTQEEQKGNFIFGITGAAIGFAQSGTGIGIIIILVILIAGIIVITIKKNKTNKQDKQARQTSKNKKYTYNKYI
ncbi:MAG: hypothetical protein ABIA78_01865 [archaeon]